MARRRHRMLGSVDLLGLNSFGQNPGISPLIGVTIGGVTAGATTIALRHAGISKSPEGFGLLTGLAVSGAMYAMKSTRHAAVASAIGAILASGLALLEKLMLGAVTVSVPGTAGMGFPNARQLGIPQMRALNGLGLPMISNVPHAAGNMPGVAGSQLAAPGGGGPPVSLMGTPTAAAMHLLGIGGPPVHGLSASYGATLLGGGR